MAFWRPGGAGYCFSSMSLVRHPSRRTAAAAGWSRELSSERDCQHEQKYSPYKCQLFPDADVYAALTAAQEYNYHLAAVNTVTFVDEGRRFVSTSDDKTIRVWEFGIPVQIKYIADPSLHSIPAVAVHPNKQWFIGARPLPALPPAVPGCTYARCRSICEEFVRCNHETLPDSALWVLRLGSHIHIVRGVFGGCVCPINQTGITSAWSALLPDYSFAFY